MKTYRNGYGHRIFVQEIGAEVDPGETFEIPDGAHYVPDGMIIIVDEAGDSAGATEPETGGE